MKAFHKFSIFILSGVVMVLSLTTTLPAGAIASQKRMSFRSIGSQDGFIRESTEDSNVNLKVNSTSSRFFVGDDDQDRQYIGILSFNTAGLPDEAVINFARVRILVYSSVGEGTGYSLLVWEICSPFFGGSVELRPNDFRAAASAMLTGGGPGSVNQYETRTLTVDEYPYINLRGYTQFRLRTEIGDNDNMSADRTVYYSGNVVNVSSRPTLFVEYYLP